MRAFSPDLALYLTLYALLFVLHAVKTLIERRPATGTAPPHAKQGLPTASRPWHQFFFFSSDVVIAAAGIALLLAAATKYVGAIVIGFALMLLATLLIDMISANGGLRVLWHMATIAVVVAATWLVFSYVITQPTPITQGSASSYRVAIPYGDLTLNDHLGPSNHRLDGISFGYFTVVENSPSPEAAVKEARRRLLSDTPESVHLFNSKAAKTVYSVSLDPILEPVVQRLPRGEDELGTTAN